MRESERWAKMIAALTSERDEAVRVAGELRAKLRPLQAGRYTVVWTNADRSVWFTTRVQNVADGSAAVLAVQMDAASEVTVINVFEGWPAEADDYDDIEGLGEDDEEADSLTASTGGSSDEPQKEIRE